MEAAHISRVFVAILVVSLAIHLKSKWVTVHISVSQTVDLSEFDGRGLSPVRKFESNQLPANTPNEDRRSVATCLQVKVSKCVHITVKLGKPPKTRTSFPSVLQSKGMLFGVFDGHGGSACAQAVSEHLLYYIAIAMMPKQSLEELESGMQHGRPVPPILQWYKNRTDFNYEPSALYVDPLRIFWQELLDSEEHDEGMK